MAKGENIFKRKDGRWEARYIKSRDITGKIQYGFCYGKTYREAKEKVTKKKAAIQGMDVAPQGYDLPYYCDKWLLYIQYDIKESTFAKYQSIMKNHIKTYFKGVLLSSLSEEMISDFRGKLLKENGLSEKTVKDILIVLRSIFKYIEEKGYKIISDPIEIYKIDIHETGDINEFITEIQIPVDINHNKND